ncbi:MAG: VCBS repeat-containing protein [Desulfobacteraceae bacterium]|nr:MAG: VCBS repeat-containing protein [Desulfobacteraceae bacterium]
MIGFALPVHASGVKRILVLPFTFNAGEGGDLTFLEKGINRMLHTRLTHANQTETIFPPKGQPLSADPFEAGKAFNADYVLTGSITMFGEKVSTDALMYSVKDKEEILSYGDFGDSKGDAIQHVNDLAVKVNFDVFGIDTLPNRAERMRLADSERYGYKKIPKFGLPNAYKYKSRVIEDEVISMAIGDINGDNVKEIIYATLTDITAMSMVHGKETGLAEYSISSFNSIVRIDAFDSNKNGRDEIIITAAGKRDLRNRSMAIELGADNEFQKVAINPNYFYAIKSTSTGQPTLVAQGREKKKEFRKGLYEVTAAPDGYSISANAYPKPEGSNIYSFATGDLLNNNAQAFVAYDDDNSIQIFDNAMMEQWRLEGEFGKSMASFNTSMDSAARESDNQPVFIQQRLFIADLNGDKKNELVVVQNIEGYTELLSRTRVIQRGQVMIYSWDKEQGLMKTWESRPLSGGIADVGIGDMNNDGKNDLVYAVTPRSKSLLATVSKQKSYITVQGF